MASDAADSPPIKRKPLATWVALGLILLVAFLLRLNELGQLHVKDLDEVFHAIVARSMMENPLHPKLYEHPYLPFDYSNWLANSTWLHKPPVAMWQMALSMWLFGESNFTMRLPSLLLSTGAVALTFLIGRELKDSRAGMLAAAFQALSPAISRLTHGQVFSDHVDIALLFYCELAVYFLLRTAATGTLRHATYAGGFMGVAYLSKSFPCMFVFGLAVLLVIARRLIRGEGELAITPRHLVRFIWAALAIALPWTFWCWFMFPREFAHEQLYVFQHLTHDIEAFAAPWDRMVFDYLFRVFLDWYPLTIAALVYIGVEGWRSRSTRRLFVFFWALGVLVPHLLAVSKTPSATLIGWPALWLATGMLIADATRGKAIALAMTLTAGLLLLTWPQFPTQPPIPREGLAPFQIMRTEWRIIAQAALIALAALAALLMSRRLVSLSRRVCSILVIGLLLWPSVRHSRIAYLTSDDIPPTVAFPIMGDFVRQNAPPEAVFFVENIARHEHLLAMWWLDRTCYPLRPQYFENELQIVLKNGGIPFILSRAKRPEAVLKVFPGEGTIYRLDQPATAPAGSN